MVEFFGPIINDQSPEYPFNGGQGFKPFAAGLNGSMTTHGAGEEDYKRAQKMELSPRKVQNEGGTIFLLETEKPLFV
ncbi:MAG: hypothetical protein M1823_008449, partial [Watsoniomyces obsoletus]